MITKTVQFSLLILLSFAALATSAVRAATDLKLWYNQPASLWEEALPIGNGRLGAMVYGKPSNETIQLNENTFWAGGPHNTINTAALSSLAGLTHLIQLFLNRTEVTDLSPLMHMERLLHLRVMNCPVADEEIAKLQKALPKCTITRR